MKFVISLLFFCTSMCALVSTGLIFGNALNSKEQVYVANKSDNVDRYSNTLTYKMIDFDVSNGISVNNNDEKSKNNVSLYFDDVVSQCAELSIELFLSCANRVLSDHFHYIPSVTVSNSYVFNQSDCDLNSYLLYDIANIMGFNVSIVYSPFHAFISWDNMKGKREYWETTTENNTGQKADLSAPVYRKTLDKTYYNPVDANEVFLVYQALVWDLATDYSYMDSFKSSTTNALITDAYFNYVQREGLLTHQDIEKIKVLLDYDVESTDKKILLSKWYFDQKEIDKSDYYLSMVKPKDCYDGCVWLRRNINLIDSFLLLPYGNFSEVVSTFNGDNSLFSYFVFLLSVVFLLFFILCSLLYRKT